MLREAQHQWEEQTHLPAPPSQASIPSAQSPTIPSPSATSPTVQQPSHSPPDTRSPSVSSPPLIDQNSPAAPGARSPASLLPAAHMLCEGWHSWQAEGWGVAGEFLRRTSPGFELKTGQRVQYKGKYEAKANTQRLCLNSSLPRMSLIALFVTRWSQFTTTMSGTSIIPSLTSPARHCRPC